ncbi:MAG: pyridoxal phosphate-dependent aminotransferase [Inconstantimicrobium porci]|uniref:Aminotransferase n=1 Tax=Inconstantimicrobium porci TaxID=2652291 RepID=A0A7X2MW53_9CLOT|nr:pyridoxal phosphate-dependent aminotransferase [Inconstantimicrobium porci]MDD6772068.1 pyridoxal phosphate-dependent aminotransferase [Inconstantimicrobium porci]MDY5912112.1 pyridoxal phosphate-dependent aminotransferase [Inconstantimicrobium porci]MSR90176.1 pyridoxal phosphate-dependent aminotransferase [Inconstantimicrobium porci]
MNLSRKANNISGSLTLEITAKANRMKSEGIDVVSFAAGEPDFNTPKNIIDAAYKAMQDGKTKYTPSSGIESLKKAICNKFKKENNLEYNINQVIVCNGAKQCIANVFLSILNPEDEVLIPRPYWVSYPELVKLADGKPIFVDTKKQNDYKYSVDVLERYVSSKTKAILLNSPGNPLGNVYTRDELTEIAAFAKKYDLFIISDEIYEKLIYDDCKHISIASLNEDAYNRTIVINGVSKSYSMTGWRIGYCAASEKIIKLMNSIQSHFTSNPNSVAQYATLEALTGDQSTIAIMAKAFDERRNIAMNMLDNINEISYIKPQGAFYIMIDISNLINKSFNDIKIKDSLAFSKLLLEAENVAVIPGSAFGFENYIRISYATSSENVKKGIERLQAFINNLK